MACCQTKPSLAFLHTLYNNTIINRIYCCQYSTSYIFTYPVKQYKHKHKGFLPKFPELHVYIHSITRASSTQGHVAKIPSITFYHILYNNTRINTEVCYQNSQSYMYTYPLQQYKHKSKFWFSKFQVLHVYTPSKTPQT